MPRGDGTGPCGLGAGSGRGVGSCSGTAKDDLSVVVIRFILANWRPILGFLLTTLLPVVAKKYQLLKASKTDDIPLLTVGRKKDEG
ncbi:MAG: hypothetical protein EOM80_16005 [Erysipelotrichia bacterium]|nr:hypothetical protein [Erysipelotrichia bacterium]